MKYALKVNGYYLKKHIKTIGKLRFFEDEKSVVKFLKSQMKLDLLKPLANKTQYRFGNVSSTETLGLYSWLVNKDLDLHYLCWSARVGKMCRDEIGKDNSSSWWAILGMLRSMPFNYTLYTLENNGDDGFVMAKQNWNRWFKANLKSGKLTKEDIKYVAE